jgi:WD40 repeat protein
MSSLLLVCLMTLSAQGPALDVHGDPLPDLARSRLGSVRFRHGCAVNHVAFTPDGKAIRATSTDDIVRVWDVRTGQERIHFPDRGAVSPDGRLIATSGWDPTLRLWDTATGKVVRTVTADGMLITSEAFSPDGKTVACILREGIDKPSFIRLFTVADGKAVRDFRPPPPTEGQGPADLWYCYFLASGKVLAASERITESLFLWDLDSGKSLPVRAKLSVRRWDAALSADGTRLAAVKKPEEGEPATVELWDVASGQQLRQFEKLDGSRLDTLWFSPDCKTLVGTGKSSDKDIVFLWDVGTGKKFAALVPPRKASGNPARVFVAFSPDSRTVAIARDDGIYLVETATGKLRHHWADFTPAGRNVWYSPHLLAFSPDGSLLAAGGDTRVRLWNLADGKEVRPVMEGHIGQVLSVAMSPDDRCVASCGSDDTVRLWDLATGRELLTIPVPPPEKPGREPRELGSLTFSPDGKSLAAGSRDGAVFLWDTVGGKRLLQLQAHKAKSSVVFVPDGKAIITSGEDGKIICWDVVSGKEVRQFRGPLLMDKFSGATAEPDTSQRLSLSPDGRLLVAAGERGLFLDPHIRIWEVATGKLRKQLREADPMFHHYAPDQPVQTGLGTGTANREPDVAVILAPGNWLLARNNGWNLHLLDVVSGKEIRHFSGDRDVNAMQFSPGGTLLAAARGDGTVSFWDPRTGTALGSLVGHNGREHYRSPGPAGARCLAFTHDGKTLISGGSDGTLLLWDVLQARDRWQSRPEPPASRELADLWRQLAGDGEVADEALRRLETAPAEAVALVRREVKPASPVEAERLKKLVADLEDERFEVRKRASDDLEKLGELAEASLRKRLADKPSLEVRQRIEPLLDKLACFVASPEQVRALRAVELLERIGTTEAQAVLQELGKGARDARLTTEAQNALGRLARKAMPLP